MIDKIAAIRKAVESECYLPALALALTLPDICGQIEYPDFKRKDKNGKEFREGRRQYVTWYNNFVKPLHYIADDEAPDFQFNGEFCYALRCSLLHEGNFELKDRTEELLIDEFRLHVDKACGTHNIHSSYHEEGGERVIDLDAYGLCFLLCRAARTFYDAHEEKAVFKKYDSVVIDESWPDAAYEELFSSGARQMEER